ncbi:DUF1963 domain-containing protein [Paenibacillus sp. NPDC058071]|uniref:DUF1963 domain-containing protein n=1 Tax=Paenibacillus sp. NPDC058071 TaxID=3346326 RepID=UPI0036DC4BA1
MKESKEIIFNEISNESLKPRIGGMSFLPEDMDWPENPDGEKLVVILSLPTDFLKSNFGLNYPEDTVVSVFTTYNQNDFFLDKIVYHGDDSELEHIRSGFTKVLLHQIGKPRNDAEYIIPAQEVIVGGPIGTEEYTGSKIGGNPSFLQNEDYSLLDEYLFCLQLYGSDYHEEYKDIFYLTDSIGYLYLNPNTDENNAGVFFTQST